MTGTATATASDGSTTNCELDLIFELTPTSTSNQYEGTYRGILKRSVQTPDGKGFSFSMEPNASAEARLVIPNIARIEVPTNGINTNSRFLQQLREFVATMDDQGRGAGTWTCAPLDTTLNGYNDNVLSASGQFLVQPISSN